MGQFKLVFLFVVTLFVSILAGASSIVPFVYKPSQIS
jgi:hypothetical protein